MGNALSTGSKNYGNEENVCLFIMGRISPHFAVLNKLSLLLQAELQISNTIEITAVLSQWVSPVIACLQQS